MRASMLAFAAAVLAWGQPAPKVTTGPAVGAAIPKFEAPDQNGKVQTLESLAGPKGTIVVFYRSADW